MWKSTFITHCLQCRPAVVHALAMKLKLYAILSLMQHDPPHMNRYTSKFLRWEHTPIQQILMSMQKQEHETSFQSYLAKDHVTNSHCIYSNSNKYCHSSRQRMHSSTARAGHVKNVQRAWQSSACSRMEERYNRPANIPLKSALNSSNTIQVPWVHTSLNGTAFQSFLVHSFLHSSSMCATHRQTDTRGNATCSICAGDAAQ